MEYVMNVLNWLNNLDQETQNLILAPVGMLVVLFLFYTSIRTWQWFVRPVLKGVHYVTIRPLTKTARIEKADRSARKIVDELTKINKSLRGRLIFTVVYPKNNKHAAVANVAYRLNNEPPVSASTPIVFDKNPQLLRLSMLQGFLTATKQISAKETSWVNEEAKVKARKNEHTLINTAFTDLKDYLHGMDLNVDFAKDQAV